MSARTVTKRACGKPLQDRQNKGRGLTGTGLRQTNYVSALKYPGDGFLLNGGWSCVADRLNSGRRYADPTKIDQNSLRVLLDSVEPSCTLSPKTSCS